MRLTELTSERNPAWIEIEVTGLTADSRAVEPGYLFAALNGSRSNGIDFIPEAIDKGAVAILSHDDMELPDVAVPVIRDP